IYFSRKFAQPIEELHKGMEEIAKNNLKYEIPELYGYELSVLGKGLNSMARSLAEKEKVEKRLVETERMAAVGKLAGDVSHEINNPLAIMKNYIYVMSKNKMAEEDPNQKYLKIIDGEIDRVAKIIRNFNDLYKGTMVASLEEVDISEPLTEILAFCNEDLKTKGITIEERVDASGKVVADKDKLKQVFLNLIKNAGEARPDGGRITVATRKEEGRIYISVTDTGTGIKPEHLKKVFDPFFTTKGVKGLGLGLAVTYGIIKNFGGDIEVASEPGKGTIFTVMLPTSSD
ncbi:MAG: HAMP domain-containing sensor histidine kinase, partial [Deltaproteobacteria bacterium]